MVELDRFVEGASLVFVFSLLANVSGMVARVLLANGYNPVTFGRIMVGYTLFNLLGTFSVWGLNTALTYYLPKSEERSEEYEIILTATILGLTISFVISGTAVLFNESIARVVFGEVALSKYTITFLIGVPVYVCLSIVTGIFRGYESVKLKAISKDMFYNFAQVGLIAAFIYIGIDGRFVGFIYALSAAGAFVLALGLLYTYYPPNSVKSLAVSYISLVSHGRRLVLYSTPVILVTLANWGLNYIDTFLIQILRGSANVGYYKAVYPISLSLIVVLGAFGFLYLPSLSRLHSEERMDEAHVLYSVSTYIGFGLTIAPFLAILFFTPTIINLLYPSSYEVAVTALQLLSLGLFIEVIFGLNSASLNAIGRTTANAAATMLAFIANIGLNIVLIPRFGISGAAAATAASLLLWNLFASVWLYYTERFHPFTLFYLKGAVSIFALTAIIYYVTEQVFALQAMDPLYQFGLLAVTGLVSSGGNLLVLMNTLPREVVEDISAFRHLKSIRLVD